MGTGPTKVGTNTTTTTNNLLNSSQLGNLYSNAENQYISGSTLYQDPSVKPAYQNYLNSGWNLANSMALTSGNEWDNAIKGGLGVNYSPVYTDLWNMGVGDTPTQQNMTGYSSSLADIAQRAPTTAAGYASDLSNIAAQAPGLGRQYADLATDYGSSAAGAGTRYGDYLTDYAREAAGAGNRYAGYLTDLGNRTLGSTNAYQNTLLDTASGRFLNSNPYLNSMYDSAADAVRRQYQTATAPQVDSVFERAQGRYGSGALANARSQNEQNLGSTLSNLASDIYGSNYARERANQLGAAESGGQLSLAEIDAARQAYKDAASAGLSGYSTGISGLSNASQSELTGYGQGASSAADAGKLALSGLEGARLGYGNAATVADTGYRTATDAYRGAGTIDTSNLSSQYSGLNALQQGYDTGNKNRLYALGQTGDIMKAQVYPYDTTLKGALGLQNVGQTASNDPWTQLGYLKDILGAGVSTGSTSTEPIYGKSWGDRLLGLGGTVLSPVLGGAGGALTSSLFGGAGSYGAGVGGDMGLSNTSGSLK